MAWTKGNKWFAWLTGLPLACWLGFIGLNAWYMTGYVPTKFGLRLQYSEGACSNDLLSYAGAFAVGLDNATVREIEDKGIDFFADIGGPREESRRIWFRDWKETPVPASAFFDGMPSFFYCGSIHGWFWPRGLRQAMEAPGSFYSDGLKGRSAVVVPSLSVIVISMHTR